MNRMPDASPLAAEAATSDIVGRLERLPMTRYQRRIFAVIIFAIIIFAVIASAWLVDQVDVALLTFLLGSIVVAFAPTPAQAGRRAAMTFAGQLSGNIAAGMASDRYGRRLVFQATMVVWGLAGLAAAAAWSLPVLMACRFLIGVGGEVPVAQAMVSEIVPANVRGRYIALMEGFWAVGSVLSGAISFFILPYLGWRRAFAAVGSLALVVLVRRARAGVAALARRAGPPRRGRRGDDADGGGGRGAHGPAAAGAAYAYGNAGGPPTLFVAGFVMQFFMFGMWSCL